jgi:hypothetical protein
MTQITHTVYWKSTDGEAKKTVFFRETLDKILEEGSLNNARIVENPDEDFNLHLQQATIYAKTRMLNKNDKALYEEKIMETYQTAYTIAVADFLNAPDIEEVDLTAYRGRKDDAIRIRVTDDFRVDQVRVEIVEAGGKVLEAGNARLQKNSNDWWYKALTDNLYLEGDCIRIQATDLPGNLTQKEHRLR